MPLFLTHKEPLWGVWKIEESVETLRSRLDNLSDYIPVLEAMRAESRQKEWLATRVLLKELLHKETPIFYHPNGAPYLNDSNLHISIAHTHGYAAVLLSQQAPVGIDIEYKSDRVAKIRSRFMTPDDEHRLDPANELNHLLLYWCAKETLFKMIGQHDVDFRQQLHIAPFPYNAVGVLHAKETKTPAEKSYAMKFLVTSDFVLTHSL